MSHPYLRRRIQAHTIHFLIFPQASKAVAIFLQFCISENLYFILNFADSDSSPIPTMLTFFHYYFTSQLIFMFLGVVSLENNVNEEQ